jgi:hypothetical protein
MVPISASPSCNPLKNNKCATLLDRTNHLYRAAARMNPTAPGGSTLRGTRRPHKFDGSENSPNASAFLIAEGLFAPL